MYTAEAPPNHASFFTYDDNCLKGITPDAGRYGKVYLVEAESLGLVGVENEDTALSAGPKVALKFGKAGATDEKDIQNLVSEAASMTIVRWVLQEAVPQFFGFAVDIDHGSGLVENLSIIMEALDRVTLREYMSAIPQPSFGQRWRVFESIGSICYFIASMGLEHNDMHSTNIMIRSQTSKYDNPLPRHISDHASGIAIDFGRMRRWVVNGDPSSAGPEALSSVASAATSTRSSTSVDDEESSIHSDAQSGYAMNPSSESAATNDSYQLISGCTISHFPDLTALGDAFATLFPETLKVQTILLERPPDWRARVSSIAEIEPALKAYENLMIERHRRTKEAGIPEFYHEQVERVLRLLEAKVADRCRTWELFARALPMGLDIIRKLESEGRVQPTFFEQFVRSLDWDLIEPTITRLKRQYTEQTSRSPYARPPNICDMFLDVVLQEDLEEQSSSES